MYARVLWGRLKLGRWDEYEKHYKETVVPASRRMRGFKGRRLLRSLQNPDEGLTVSFWETKADMDAYVSSAEREAIAQKGDELYTGDYWVKEFEIRSVDEG